MDQLLMPPVGSYSRWRAGPVIDVKQSWQALTGPTRKAVVFLIDRTWRPILGTAIKATAEIFSKHLMANDEVGLYSMGDGWIFDLTHKGTGPVAAGLLKKIKDAETMRGKANIYGSMQAVLGLSKPGRFAAHLADPTVAKWLVVLTDLVHLCPAKDWVNVADELKMLSQVMSTAPDFNLAVIDSSAISGYEPHHVLWPHWKSNMSEMEKAIEAASNTSRAYHISAKSSADIKAAFERVASLMDSNHAEEHL